jgi:hypothetical protein
MVRVLPKGAKNNSLNILHLTLRNHLRVRAGSLSLVTESKRRWTLFRAPPRTIKRIQEADRVYCEATLHSALFVRPEHKNGRLSVESLCGCPRGEHIALVTSGPWNRIGYTSDWLHLRIASGQPERRSGP